MENMKNRPTHEIFQAHKAAVDAALVSKDIRSSALVADLRAELDRREVIMYGCTEEEMTSEAAHNMRDPVLLNGYANCVLSDARDAAMKGKTDLARQWINKAMFFIQESTSLQRAKERA